jgi:hypothetical protein
MVSYDCQLIKCKVIIAELRYTGKVRTGQGNHNRSFGLTDFALADLLGRGRSIAAPQQKNRARRPKRQKGRRATTDACAPHVVAAEEIEMSNFVFDRFAIQ